VPRTRRTKRTRPRTGRIEPVVVERDAPTPTERDVEATNGGTDRSATASPAPAPRTTDAAWAERLFVPAALLVLFVAAALRLPELALNPFHHDEGVNGFFTTNLVRNGVYAYDPANYHGPTLYYFAFVSEILFGLTTEAMRLVPVFFGLLTVGVVLAARPLLGPIAAVTAGGLLAISPGAVYVSRYFIHEALLVCFSVALVVSILLYLRSPKPAFVLTAAAAAALMFATKETGIITVAVLGIAAVASRIYVDMRGGDTGIFARASRAARDAAGARNRRAARTIWVDGVEYRATPRGPAWAAGRGLQPELLAAAAIVFIVIYVLFFSSFFTNFPKGLADSLATFTIWTQTGGETQVQPFEAYLAWMARADAPILVLGVVGGLIAAIRGRDRLWVFIGLWALGTTLAYSLVAYKTPWIALNMLAPLALLGGLAIREGLARRRWRPLVPVALVAAIGLSGYQAIDLNYRHYDDERYPYVFVHTTRSMLRLVDEIEEVADRLGTGTETGVVFVTRDYWPMPWYLRDYPRAGFFGQIVETEEPMIVANVTQEAEVAEQYGETYTKAGTYNLRPGVDLDLYLRSDVAAP
jgi:uncharacterized protein (TIGR03663 family)